MKTAKKVKPYWEMNAEELAAATSEFDRELCPDEFRPLGPEKRKIWQRLQEANGTEESCEPLAPVRLCSAADVATLRAKIKQAAMALAQRLKKLAADKPFDLLKDFKLERFGYNPYDPLKEMNLIEQINQSATLLVGCAAVEQLLRKHPSKEGYFISKPTSKGYDVWADDVSVVAEVFAATSPGSNQKIRKDLDAVLKPKAPFTPKHRYVFFVSRSLAGFPPKKYPLTPGSDPQLVGTVWWYLQDGHRAVTVVSLPEEAVFLE